MSATESFIRYCCAVKSVKSLFSKQFLNVTEMRELYTNFAAMSTYRILIREIN